MGKWLKENVNVRALIWIAAFAALFVYWFWGLTFTEIVDRLINVGLIVFGLGLVIFIHELGHFLAAKACDVKVVTFSIGFGRAIPGCRFQRGETEYKLAVIPLGGYVKMVGQTDPGEEEVGDAENDPRSYKNKSVPQRMLIISAGVIMNILLGIACFIYVYLSGKTEVAGQIGAIEPGSPAFLAGMEAGSKLIKVDDIENPHLISLPPGAKVEFVGNNQLKVGDRTLTYDENKNPTFEDLFFATAFAKPDVTRIGFKWITPDGVVREEFITPRRRKDIDPKPVIGVGFPDGLILHRPEREGEVPARKGRPARDAAFQGRDRLVGVRAEGEKEFQKLASGWDLTAAMYKYRAQAVEFQVERKGKPPRLEIVGPVTPEPFMDIGLRMKPGKIVAVAPPGGDKGRVGDLAVDDVIRGFPDTPDVNPLRLPDLVMERAVASSNHTVELLVWTNGDSTKPRTVNVRPDTNRGTWNEQQPGGPNPVSIPGLGVAYNVEPVIDGIEPESPAAAAKLQVGDIVKEASWTMPNGSWTDWFKIGAGKLNWPAVFMRLQGAPDTQLKLKIERPGQGELEPVILTPVPVKGWFLPDDRGLLLERETRIVTADTVGQAIGIGFKDTIRTIGRIYLHLHGLVTGNLSVKENLAGPIRIVDASYKLAERGINDLILFLGMISVNLAVVNFLPIPVLDGGHFLFLSIEGIQGRPVSERVQGVATLIGLVLLAGLMLFVIILDVSKLWL